MKSRKFPHSNYHFPKVNLFVYSPRNVPVSSFWRLRWSILDEKFKDLGPSFGSAMDKLCDLGMLVNHGFYFCKLRVVYYDF